MENYEESMSCYDEALLRMETLLGPDHPRTVEMVLAKATLLVRIGGDFDETNALFQRCIQAQERSLGEDHVDVLEALQEYSLFLHLRGKLDDAEKCLQALLLRQEKRHGCEHIALVETLTNLGKVLSELGREDAEEMYRRALALATKLDGGDEVFSLACMQNLASYLHQHGIDNDEAEVLYRRVLDLKRASSNEDGADTYQTLDELVEMLISQGKFEEAETAQRELVELSQTILQRDSEEHLGALATLAWILTKSGKFSDAEQIYLECIEALTSTTGEDGERTLHVSAKLAWNMELEGKSEEALLRVLEALQKSKKRYGALHPLSLKVEAITAAIHFRQGDEATAISLSREVLKGSRSLFEAQSDEIGAAEANLALYTEQAKGNIPKSQPSSPLTLDDRPGSSI